MTELIIIVLLLVVASGLVAGYLLDQAIQKMNDVHSGLGVAKDMDFLA